MKEIGGIIKRNRLDKLSGEYYRDVKSEFIQHLNSMGKNAVVGIQRDDGIYTIIGVDKIYFVTPSNQEREMRLSDFLAILNQVTLAQGKGMQYEFLKINEIDSVWVMNAETMNALWNTMLILNRSS
jgi:hypothetical protein